MKRIVVVVAMALTCRLMGAYWQDPSTGIWWLYQVNDGNATVGGGTERGTAISQTTTGDIVIPSAINGYPVATINNYAFWRCDKLTSVDIPNGVTHVGDFAFVECGSITNVQLSASIKSIGYGAFAGTAIRTIQLPGTLQSLGSTVFGSCTNLVDLVIPNSLSDGMSYTVQNCTSLTNLVVPYVGRCRNNLDVSGNADAILGRIIGVRSDYPHVADPEYKDGCKRVAQYYTFSSYMYVYIPTNLTSVTVTDDTLIGLGAFSGCSMLKYVVIGDKTETIRDLAFYGCSGLKEVRFGKGLKSIGDKAFAGCNEFNIYFVGNNPDVSSTVFGDPFDTLSGYASSNGMVYVEYGTKGWNGDYSSLDLPEDGLWPSSGVVRRKIAYNPETYHPPVFSRGEGTFDGISIEIEISCDDCEAEIYYTLDGSAPSEENGKRYSKPIALYETKTIRAVSVKSGWLANPVASATFTKANEIGPAINMLEVLPDNDKTHPWTVVSDVTHDGVSAVKSGEIEDDESTTLKVTVYGAGQLSFWWKTSCEPSIGGEYYDYATFYNGSTAITNLAGVTDWQQVWLDVAGTGKHTFKWTYHKDDSSSTVPDGMWLDQVQWLPATTDYYSDHTLTTETPVKYNWLRKYGLGVTTDFESAAKAKSGKYDGAGRELTVEQEYIAGTDPTNETSHLTSSIEMVDGLPIITWTPDLNEGGAKSERAYKIWGSSNLENGGDWEWPTNALHRFFKVTVEMP